MILLEELKNSLNEENIAEMKKLEMPFEWLLRECNEMVEEQKIVNYNINDIVKEVINEYMGQLIFRENRKYDLDRE
ncbi:hypothetical protein JYG23_05090 [Sedimentibacter sp. zth1]|uniref:hypothetical protein n=1 Tax=Sedimentibacter sp. zth1 TaxID=2816908 RepID=UPI001A920D7C|nr:hypothetical protein [Sedimentibacter sp. zth1]QSX06827.1 hypothetical protein JYG23_05090 [Sedimentibacter sp. zth1]